ncbi:hypothetical protein C8J57DRAFT_1521325 [Mycena rebaudengoi]|nr:hypothetical protein C8J57DRAFT_1521325 [Mycena rebaudengoi]
MPSKSMDADDLDLRPHSLEIKGESGLNTPSATTYCWRTPPSTHPLRIRMQNIAAFTDVAPENDKDECYGLEYSLELSTRERRALDMHSFAAGEHSKSRESWAAIHQGTIHPFCEDEEYHRWESWHHALEHQDERRRHRRARAFKASAKELAWYYSEKAL